MEYGNRNMDWGNGGYGGGYGPEHEKAAVRQVRRCFSRVGAAYVVFVAVSNASQAGAALFLSRAGMVEKLGRDLCMLLTLLGMYPLAVPLAAVLMKLAPSCGEVERERWGFGKLCGFFIFSMGILYTGNFIGTVLMAAAGMVRGEPVSNEVQELVLSMNPWVTLAVAVVAAPVMEELVFRKFLLDRIAGFGHWTAMLVSGVVFGIAHGNFYQFFYAFGLGMVFAYVYLHTGRIAYPIGFHMAINFCGSILPIGLLAVIKENAVIGALLAMGNVMVMLGFVACAIVFLACFWKDLWFRPGMDGLPVAKKAAAVWGNMGMALFLLLGAGMFALSL